MGKLYCRKSDKDGLHVVSITDKKHIRFVNAQIVEAASKKEEQVLERDPVVIEYKGSNYWGGKAEESESDEE